MAVTTLDALITTEQTAQAAAAATVANGEAAKATAQRLANVVSQLTATRALRDSSTSGATTALAKLPKVDGTALKTKVSAALAALGLDDAKLEAVAVKPLSSGQTYDKVLAAAQASDADVGAKNVAAQELGIDADAARRKVDVRVAALNAYVASIGGAAVSAQALIGIGLDGTRGSLAQAWWQLRKSGKLLLIVAGGAASAKTFTDAVAAACDAFADADSKWLAACDAVSAARATQTQAWASVGAADAEVLAALVALVKAAPAAAVAPVAPAAPAPVAPPAPGPAGPAPDKATP